MKAAIIAAGQRARPRAAESTGLFVAASVPHFPADATAGPKGGHSTRILCWFEGCCAPEEGIVLAAGFPAPESVEVWSIFSPSRISTWLEFMTCPSVPASCAGVTLPWIDCNIQTNILATVSPTSAISSASSLPTDRRASSTSRSIVSAMFTAPTTSSSESAAMASAAPCVARVAASSFLDPVAGLWSSPPVPASSRRSSSPLASLRQARASSLRPSSSLSPISLATPPAISARSSHQRFRAGPSKSSLSRSSRVADALSSAAPTAASTSRAADSRRAVSAESTSRSVISIPEEP
mmetsp:Transcript_35653/g.72951  ORF Transcript_35653/g.72951 Transcript_35653/m.72951 type:complete len:295 (-) Transcript_35653:136-1020(-)